MDSFRRNLFCSVHLASAGVAASLRCRYSSGKSSSAQSTQTVTSTGAGGVSAGSGSTSAGQGSLVVGQGAKYNESGTLDLSQASDVTINSTSADPQVLQAALQTVGDFANQLTTATQNNEAALSALATTVQTGNQSQQNNIVLYVVIAGVVAVVIVILTIFHRSK